MLRAFIVANALLNSWKPYRKQVSVHLWGRCSQHGTVTPAASWIAWNWTLSCFASPFHWNENLRRSIPNDCHRGDPGGLRRSRDDRFLRRGRRHPSSAAMERLLHGLVRSSTERSADVDGLQLATDSPDPL